MWNVPFTSLQSFDMKVVEHTFAQLDTELGLRHVVAQEFFSADKKIWNAIIKLYAQGSWTFEECLNEMTVVRSDISSLLQPRPRIPKAPPSSTRWQRQRRQRQKVGKEKMERENQNPISSTKRTNAPTASRTTRKSHYV